MKEKKDTCIQAIKAVYPELTVQRAHFFNHDGQYSDILIVNEDLVFRFPRYDAGIQTIGKEVDILKRIQRHTTLALPNPIYSATDPSTSPKVFMGYKMIHGDALWRQNLQAQSQEILRRWAAQLAGFLLELHSIPLRVFGQGLPVYERPEELAALLDDFRHYLFPFMRPDACQWVDDHFETFLKTPGLSSYSISLRHGDFGLGNILYDPEHLIITGIIDFSFAGLGDPAVDIASASTLGPDLFDHFEDTYSELPSTMERAKFYKGTFALSEALHGIKNDDRQAFESGISAYV